MATRSNIALQISEDNFKKVYCHWDGYPEYNGKILLENYDTRAKVEELLSFGDISSLAERVSPSIENNQLPHTFETPHNNVTVFYGRDRGEEGVEAKERDLKRLLDNFDSVDFIYIFTLDNKWEFYSYTNRKPVDLEKYLNR